MSKEPVTLAQLLAHSIERWYESDSHFARTAGVSSSAVSRIIAGQIPKIETIEKMAPHIKDDRGRPYTSAFLAAIAHPALAKAGAAPPAAPVKAHRLAVVIERIFAEDSPVPQDKQAALEPLLDALLDPYQAYFRKRKAS